MKTELTSTDKPTNSVKPHAATAILNADLKIVSVLVNKN